MMRGVLIVIGYLLVSLVPSDNSLWVFTSHAGGTFAENSKYQFLYSSRQEGIRTVWISTSPETVAAVREAGYEAYRYSSLKGKIILLRSGVFVSSHPILKPFGANATVIQLWHGNMLKRMGQDKEEMESGILRRLYHRTIGRNWDYFVVTSSGKPAEHARSAYGLTDDQLLVTGYPRTDVLLREEPDAMVDIQDEIQELFETLDGDGPLICLMPTWNGGRTAETRFSQEHVALEELDSMLASFDANLMIKQHAHTRTPLDTSGLERIVTISTTIDIYPFLQYIDIVITDYSSIQFDFLLVDNPLVFYPYDLEEYVENRGLYFEYESFVPGPVAKDPAGLNGVVESVLKDVDAYAEARQQLREVYFAFQDGKACERIHNRVVDSALHV